MGGVVRASSNIWGRRSAGLDGLSDPAFFVKPDPAPDVGLTHSGLALPLAVDVEPVESIFRSLSRLVILEKASMLLFSSFSRAPAKAAVASSHPWFQPNHRN